MSRAIIYFLKEDADGLIQLDRDLNVNNLSVTKDGSAFGGSFTSNGDGTYYFSPSGSGVYSVFLNGLVQDEFRDIYVPTNDILLTSQIDNTSIVLDGRNRLSVVNADTLLRQPDVVDNLNSTSSVYPLSANQGLQLSASISTKLGSAVTLLFEEDIINDFETGGSDKVQAASTLKIDFGGTNYLSDQTSYNAALRELDRRIGLIQVGGNYISYIPFGLEVSQSEASSSTYLNTADGVSNSRGYKMPSAGTVNGLSAVWNLSSYTRGGSGDYYSILFDVYVNGSPKYYCQIDEFFTGVGVYSAYATTPTGVINAGDTVNVQWRVQEGIGDSFVMHDIACLVRLTS